MTRKATLLTLFGVGALFYFIFSFSLPGLFQLAGSKLWLVRIALWVLGVASASFGYWFLSKRSPKARHAETAMDLGAEVALTLATAKAALTRSGLKGGLGKRSMILFMGPTSSGKTSAVVNSGIQPYALAGDNQSDTDKPTNGINIWFDQDTQSALVEIGGGFGEDDRKWSKLIHGLRPRNLLAILGREAAPARAVVVCVSCEELTQRDDAHRSHLAKVIKKRLADMSRQMGVMLPFYVLFTKTDVIPHFDAYVDRLKPDEVDEVVGASLPFDFATHTSSYTDRMRGRIDSEFNHLTMSLANKRLALLEREATIDVKGRAYEFPRELQRQQFVRALGEFLTELVKPSDLSINPLFRGFYFTGRRLTSFEQASDNTPRRSVQPPSGASATSAFGAVMPVQEPVLTPRPQTQEGWQHIFLRRFFRNVVLADEMAKQITGAGAAINFNRRVLLGVAIFVPVLFTMCVGQSHLGNSRLRAEVLSSVEGLRGGPPDASQLPPLETMQHVESLWEHLDVLRQNEAGSPPMSLRWGLYSGSRIEPDVRRVYAAAYDTLMLQPVLARLGNELRNLQPDSGRLLEFTKPKNSLKAYLMLTSERSRIDHAFLDTVLVDRWFGSRGAPGNRGPTEALALNQFSRFGDDLCNNIGVTCPQIADPAIVRPACTYLTTISNADQVYRSTIASTRFDSLRLSDQFDGRAANHVSTDYVVPGAFTVEAWPEIRRRLENADHLGDDQWICPEAANVSSARRFAQENLRKYFDQYRGHWLSFLQGTRVVQFSSNNDAVSRLEVLSANDSPLLRLLALVARHTAADEVEIAPMFQPVHHVAPPAATSIVNDNNRTYLDQLVAVKSALELLNQGVPDAAQGVADARTTAQAALDHVNSMARDFEGGAAADVSTSVQALLRAPITHAQTRLGTYESSGLNGRIDTFCQDYNGLAAYYPFTSTGRDAPIDRVTQMFQPSSGSLQQFYGETLQEHLVRTSDGYDRRSGSSLPRRFVDFFNSASDISMALFPADAQRLSLNFGIRGETTPSIPEISLTVDGKSETYTRTAPDFRTVFWIADGASSASLSASINGRPTQLFSLNGPWALFRLFGQTSSFRRQANGLFEAVWNVPGAAGQTVTATIDFYGNRPFLEPNYLASLRCGR